MRWASAGAQKGDFHELENGVYDDYDKCPLEHFPISMHRTLRRRSSFDIRLA
jgi:hypothetical protein